MNNYFDVDAFTLKKLKLNGAEYCFRPMTNRDHEEYVKPVLIPKLAQNLETSEYVKVAIEAIKRRIEDIPEDDLRDVPNSVLNDIFSYVLHGIHPEDEKNF